MYDPTIGQFISEDPIEFEAGDPNLRRYVGNSPTNATDPSGLKARFDDATIAAMKRIFGAENLAIDGNIVSFSNAQAAAIASYNYVQKTNGSKAFRISLWKAIADSDTFSLDDIVSGRSDAILAPPSSCDAKSSTARERPSPNSVSAFVQRQRPTGLSREETRIIVQAEINREVAEIFKPLGDLLKAELIAAGLELAGAPLFNGSARFRGRIPSAEPPYISRSRTRSVYHKGELLGGRVGTHRELSTGLDRSSVEALDRAGKVHEFRIPEDTLQRWEFEGKVRRLRDYDHVTRTCNEELRFHPSVADELNTYKVK